MPREIHLRQCIPRPTIITRRRIAIRHSQPPTAPSPIPTVILFARVLPRQIVVVLDVVLLLLRRLGLVRLVRHGLVLLHGLFGLGAADAEDGGDGGVGGGLVLGLLGLFRSV